MKRLFVCVMLAATGAIAGYAQAASTLPGNTPLAPGQSLQSDNGKYILIMQQTDGNLVVYRKADMKVLWASGKLGGPNAWAVAQRDHNFVVYAGPLPANGAVVWQSGTVQPVDDPSTVLYIGLNGQVGISGNGGPFWTSPGDPDVCGDGNPKTSYPACLRPGTKDQQNAFITACTYADAQRQAAQMINAGAVLGYCH